VRLDRERAWVDVFAFERALAAAEAAARQHDPAAAAHRARALALYEGAFLAEDDAEPWTVAARERLRGRFIHALAQHGADLEAAGDREGAIAAYLRGIDADPVVEGFHQGLMRCYAADGRATEAMAAYRRLRQILSVTLGLAPSPASEQLFRSLR
jgi:DNA-binding SARP family transcriptional activator